MGPTELGEMVTAYVACALWAGLDWAGMTEGDDNPEPLDDAYDADDLAPATLEEIREECRQFIVSEARDLAGMDPEQAGHDFYLTRNGHGAGFWGPPLPPPVRRPPPRRDPRGGPPGPRAPLPLPLKGPTMPENLRTREDDLRAWLSIGISRGWVSEPYCSAHDQPPITDAERAEMRARDQDEWDMEMLDSCQTSVRVFQDAPAPPDLNPEVCPICHGHGYLLDQGYGYTEMPADAVPVQRCDACDRYPGDLFAAQAAAKDLGTTFGAQFDSDGNIKPVTDPEGGEFPGDAWIRIPRDDAGLPVIPLPLVSPEAITATQRLCHEYGARGVRNIIDALVRRGEA